MISKRISNILYDKECFDKAPPDCKNGLKNSGFDKNIKFTPRSPKEENETETFYGLICRLAPTFRPTLAKCFCDS